MYDVDVTSQGSGLFAFGPGVYSSSLLLMIFSIVCYWKVFKKAGKEGWEAIIPIYNTIVSFQIAKINPLVILWLLLPIIGWIIYFVYYIKAQINMAKLFGKSSAFALGLIFLPTIFVAILAFDSSTYNDSAVA